MMDAAVTILFVVLISGAVLIGLVGHSTRHQQ